MCLSKRNPDTGENPRVHSGSIKFVFLDVGAAAQ